MALRLNRNVGQKIMLGNDPVVITLLSVDKNKQQASIQIDAPKNISIDREEIYLDKQKELKP